MAVASYAFFGLRTPAFVKSICIRVFLCTLPIAPCYKRKLIGDFAEIASISKPSLLRLGMGRSWMIRPKRTNHLMERTDSDSVEENYSFVILDSFVTSFTEIERLWFVSQRSQWFKTIYQFLNIRFAHNRGIHSLFVHCPNLIAFYYHKKHFTFHVSMEIKQNVLVLKCPTNFK